MNVTLKTAVKRDYFQIQQYSKQFRNEYEGTLADLSTRTKADTIEEIHRGVNYIIQINDRPVGLVDFCKITHKQTGKFLYNTIQNMYIEPEFRGQGVAQQVRALARRHHSVMSVMITYGRAKQLTGYYSQQGFNWVRVYSELEPLADDNALCLVLTCQQREIELKNCLLSEDRFRRMDYYGVTETQQIAKIAMQRRFGIL